MSFLGSLGNALVDGASDTVTNLFTGSSNIQNTPGDTLYAPFPRQLSTMLQNASSQGIFGNTIGGALSSAIGAVDSIANVADLLMYYQNLMINKKLFGQSSTSLMNLVKDYVIIYTESFDDVVGIGNSIRIPFYFLFFPNPKSVEFAYSHKTNVTRARNRVFPDFEAKDLSLTMDGYMAGALCPTMTIGGESFGGLIRPLRRFSFGYWMEHMLRAIFLSNGYVYGRGRQTYYQRPDKDSRLMITIRDKVYEGHMTSFTEKEDSSQPFLIPFTFSFDVFRVWQVPASVYSFQVLSGVPVVNLADMLGGSFGNVSNISSFGVIGREV